MLKKFVYFEGEDGYCVDFSVSGLEKIISCACGCICDRIRRSIDTTMIICIYHPITFGRKKLSGSKQNYNTTEGEGLVMVYPLQKYIKYMLGKHLEMSTEHSSLTYLINKPVLGGRICRWLLLFQEFNFEVVMNPGRLNVGPYHLSRITNGEEPINLEDNFPDAQFFLS
jgi:hypothetical protein